MAKASTAHREGSVGAQLQYWRRARHLSQLALATEAEVSPRHICFIETGRANPSREMVLLLSRALDVPLRERNSLLLAAGFAPVYRETNLDAPELGPIRGALDAILRQQEPFPAIVMNRHWDIVRANAASTRLARLLLGERAATAPPNLLRRIFDPDSMRPFVANWKAVAESLVQRVHREAVGGVTDERTRALLADLLAYPGVPRTWLQPDPGATLTPVVPVSYVKGERRFDFFSTVTTLGTPQDITLQEVRIECFFPANPATEAAARDLAQEHPKTC
jgi:transcriptional regulator with XRE-family HTH domain